MTTVEIHFLIFYPDHAPIENHVQYEIRHEIAKMFENSGFGDVIENGQHRFMNVYAIPTEDDIIDAELSLFYAFNTHENRNNNRILTSFAIEELHNLIREQYHMQIITIQRFLN